MLFRDKLYYILEELNSHKRTPLELMKVCVEERLESSLNSYKHSLENSYSYLSTKDEMNVLKKLNRSLK